MAGFAHSEALFVHETGMPMKFSMRPCEEKSKLKPVIEHGGGILTSKSSVDRNSIRLADPGSKVLSDNCISSKYVWDCASSNKLLNIDSYRLSRTDTSENLDFTDCVNKITVCERETKTRREYLYGDDMKIINFISDNRRFSEVKGLMLWKDIERLQIVPDRTYQSLRERFVKTILPRIHTYRISEKEIKKFKQPFCNEDCYSSGDASSEASSIFDKAAKTTGRKKALNYTENEDLDIIEYILEDAERIYSIKGNEIWKAMERNQVTDHTWQSMRDRFLKRILPNIASYQVSKGLQNNLKILIAHFFPKSELELNKSKKRTDSEVSDSGNEILHTNKSGSKEIDIIEVNPLDIPKKSENLPVNGQSKPENTAVESSVIAKISRLKTKGPISKLETLDVLESDNNEVAQKGIPTKRRKLKKREKNVLLNDSDKLNVIDSDKTDSSIEVVPDSSDTTPLRKNRMDTKNSEETELDSFSLNSLPALAHKDSLIVNGGGAFQPSLKNSVSSEDSSFYCTAPLPQNTIKEIMNSSLNSDSLITLRSPNVIEEMKKKLKLVLNHPIEAAKPSSNILSSPLNKKKKKKRGDLLEKGGESPITIQKIIEELNTDWSEKSEDEVSFKTDPAHLKLNGNIEAFEKDKQSQTRTQNHIMRPKNLKSSTVAEEHSEETDVDVEIVENGNFEIPKDEQAISVTSRNRPLIKASKEVNSDSDKDSSFVESPHKSKKIPKKKTQTNSLSLPISSPSLPSDSEPTKLKKYKYTLRNAGKSKYVDNTKDERELESNVGNVDSSEKSKYFNSEISKRTSDKNDLQPTWISTRHSKRLRKNDKSPSDSQSEKYIVNTVINSKCTLKESETEISVPEAVVKSSAESERRNLDQLPEDDIVMGSVENLGNVRLDIGAKNQEEMDDPADSISSKETEIYISDGEENLTLRLSQKESTEDLIKHYKRLKECSVEDFTAEDDLALMKLLMEILGCNTTDLLNILDSEEFAVNSSVRALLETLQL